MAGNSELTCRPSQIASSPYVAFAVPVLIVLKKGLRQLGLAWYAICWSWTVGSRGLTRIRALVPKRGISDRIGF
jgi:hypothetical protein